MPSYYIAVSKFKDKLVEANSKVNWYPEYVGTKRFNNWLMNAKDWAISRTRYWGAPIPYFKCECGHSEMIGSIEELKEKAVNPDKVDKIPNLHRPYIDEIKIKCDCGCEVERVTEVGDVWLDAGITPFSTKKYFTDKEYFNNNFPSDYVCEMVEQIKLWFYSLLIMSVVLTGKAPYKKLVTYQYVKDEHGGEFHKSGGNTLEAEVIADKVGADVIRYLYCSSSPANDMRFGFNLTDEARRKLLSFWNIYTFFNTYAVIDNPDISNFKPNEKDFSFADKWLIESVNNFIVNSDENYANDKCFVIVKDFEKLIDDISNFYIRSNRKRFWKSENKRDQMTAYWCLYYAIKSIIRVMCPIIPFMSEHIWQNLVREIEKDEKLCIMLSGYPEKIYDKKFDDVILQVSIAREIISQAQRLRNENQIKVKQPLRKLFVGGDENIDKVIVNLGDIIQEELNIKTIEKIESESKFNDYFLTVNFKKAGAYLKQNVQKLKSLLTECDDETMKQLVEMFNNGNINIGEFNDLSSELFNLEKKAKKEYIISHENNITVAIDITIDEELEREGYYREFVRGLQVLRKTADFQIDERICASFKTEDKNLQEMIDLFKNKIQSEVLINNILSEIENPSIESEIEVGEGKIKVAFKGNK